MNYLTNYYKNRCTQLQEQVNRLSNRIRLLSEDDSYAGEAQERPAGNPENPWMTPEYQVPPLDPNQSPVRPPNEGEWERNNPRPNPNNYPGGEENPDYWRDVGLWREAWARAYINYMTWFRHMRGLNRITGQGKDREWILPRFGDPEREG